MSASRRIRKGILGGVAATAALSAARATLKRYGVVSETAPDQVIERLQDVGLLENLSATSRQPLSVGAHILYGVGTGAVFGMLREERGTLRGEVSAGVALGVLAWGAGWAFWLPLTGVHPAPWSHPSPNVLLPILDHAVFGAAWGLVYRAVSSTPK